MSIMPVLKYKKRMAKYTLIFLILTIISVIISGLSLRFQISVWAILIPLFGFMFFGAAGGVTFGFYMNGRRYLHLLSALGSDVINAKVIKGTLNCQTKNQGEFSTDYIIQGEYGRNNHYRLWINTNKRFPVPDYKSHNGKWYIRFDTEGDLLTNIIIENGGEKVILDMPDNFPVSKLKDIKSIYEIKLTTYHGENRIFAEFGDLWPHKETHDLIRALDILRTIEEIL